MPVRSATPPGRSSTVPRPATSPRTRRRRPTKLIDGLGSRMAKHVVLTSRPQYRSAFKKYISGREGLLTNDERMAVAAVEEARTALALADANGGYAVPALLDPSVIYTGSGTANPMRQVSRIVHRHRRHVAWRHLGRNHGVVGFGSHPGVR
jgi:hypothetical protein